MSSQNTVGSMWTFFITSSWIKDWELEIRITATVWSSLATWESLWSSLSLKLWYSSELIHTTTTFTTADLSWWNHTSIRRHQEACLKWFWNTHALIPGDRSYHSPSPTNLCPWITCKTNKSLVNRVKASRGRGTLNVWHSNQFFLVVKHF